jgi:hypothetical protein
MVETRMVRVVNGGRNGEERRVMGECEEGMREAWEETIDERVVGMIEVSVDRRSTKKARKRKRTFFLIPLLECRCFVVAKEREPSPNALVLNTLMLLEANIGYEEFNED